MGTLNQYASRIAHLVNQPDNHALKERIKDMIKTVFANRIRQSVEKHGLDDILKLSYEIDIKNNPNDNTESITINKVATPIRLISDAPFMFVGTNDGIAYRYENSKTAAKCRKSGRQTHTPTGSSTSYYLDNGYIHITPKISNISKIKITSIFENPDEVLSVISTNDGQDIELPLPNDMLEDIIYTILKVEFNMYPKDIDIKINSDSQTTGDKQNNQ